MPFPNKLTLLLGIITLTLSIACTSTPTPDIRYTGWGADDKEVCL